MQNTPSKKPESRPRKKKLAGTPRADCLPIPIKVEKLTDANGERFTELTFGEPFKTPVRHSADRFFADAIEVPGLLVDPLVWLIIKPWLQNDPAQIAAFWRVFNTPQAIQERRSAISGIKAVKWQKERLLIQMAHATRRLLSEPEEVIPSPHLFPFETTLMYNLAEWVLNAVENDHEAPRRLHRLLKDPTAADDKSNEEFVNRGVFNAFERLVAKDEKLPTKKRVRAAAYLGNDQSGISTASRAFRELGLSGLPEG